MHFIFVNEYEIAEILQKYSACYNIDSLSLLNSY